MKKLNRWFHQHFQKGSNRLTIFLNNKYVIKIPLHKQGIKANIVEFNNSKLYKNLVAKTFLYPPFIIQERLYKTVIFPLDCNSADIPEEMQSLFDIKLHNRLQVGWSVEDKTWKIFDYEDIKFKRDKL